MPKIIQFTHPGGEHGCDKENANHKSWNCNAHKRKFLVTHGSYVDEMNLLKEAQLMFWGEWEPPSNVTALLTNNDKLMPKWLHRPYLPGKLPEAKSNEPSCISCTNEKQQDDIYQNTDPYVFGNSFKYFVCKQSKVPQLRDLGKGSLILFGSTKGLKRDEAFFQLDTVFVVADFLEYDAADINALVDERVPEIYRQVVYKMLFKQPEKSPLKRRLYFGATYQNQYDGMYSFSPAKVYKNDKSGFPRIRLKNMNYITNNLNAAPKISNVNSLEVKQFWGEICKISRSQGCVEGVRFDI